MASANTGYSHDFRPRATTPKCGAFRENTKNCLLAEMQLGCVKPTQYDLPSKTNLQHEYGLRQERDGSCSADVVGNWAQSEPNPNIEPARDFRSLNKFAVMAGKTSCKDMAEFRQTHDVRLKIGTQTVKVKQPWAATDTSFGRPTQQGTNMNDLFSHSYRYDWVAEAPPAEQLIAAKKPKKPTMTKSAIAMVAASQQKMSEAETKEPWKMKAFQAVPAKIGPMG